MVTPPLVVLTSRPEPVPAVPVEVDVQAAVGRVSFDVATCATKVHATVERVETDAPPHVADRDAAVVGLEIQVRVVRHHDLPAHTTALSPARVGALGAQAATVGRDTYGAHELLRPRLCDLLESPQHRDPALDLPRRPLTKRSARRFDRLLDRCWIG